MSETAAQTASDPSPAYPDDDEILTARERAQERMAEAEERRKLQWMNQTPEELAERIPTSVFAMGDLVTNDR